jgi:hypothetical protein
MDEKNQEYPQQNDPVLPEEGLDLDAIMKEFSPEEASEAEDFADVPQEDIPEPEELPQEMYPSDEAFEEFLYDAPSEEAQLQGSPVTDDTVRIELAPSKKKNSELGDTIRLDNVVKAVKEQLPEEPEEPVALDEPEEIRIADPILPKKEEPYSENWEPEYEQPMGEYIPPQPLVLHPRSKLHELKRKLVAGPERRYYEINEVGFGKLQVAIFLSLLIVLVSGGVTALYAMGMVPENRLKLLVFGQFLAMLLSALLGSYQLLSGVTSMLRGRFTLNSLLFFTFVACCADGVFGLLQQRVSCCAAFSLQVTLSLWGTYHKRSTEMDMMDTMRKASRLDGIMRVKDFYDGCDGLLRSEGQVEDFMDHYEEPSRPEKVMNAYALVALAVSITSGVLGGVLHESVSFGVQVASVSLLAALPVTSFITLRRPMAILEKRLHKLGAVLCGWRGISGMSHKVLFPISHEDLFPVGTCKLNGVKFYGSRNPDQVVAYCTAMVRADGSGLTPLFDQLLTSRNGRHYDVENLRAYGNGGIGGEVCGESVLLGSVAFLKAMGVEVPSGTNVAQAVYAAIDGEFACVFAINYGKTRSATTGLRTLCGYRGLRPVLTTGDFILTEGFLRNRFSVNGRRICFPDHNVRAELAAVQVPEQTPALALITTDGLASYAFAVTGARALRTASWLGVGIHLAGGIVGLVMMLILAALGESQLLTPSNLFLYELIWMIPGFLITEWTRSL